jgi:tRNA threonylcarbamoyl adenosine modification protein YeaZ
MLGLAIHTCSPTLGLAIDNFAGEAHAQTWDLGRDLSAHLHTTLVDFLYPHTWPDLSFLAVARGPGGFTGTRIGVVTARTLAQQLDIPLFGISTLAAAAQAKVEQDFLAVRQPAPHIAVDMRAQRNMRFTAIYALSQTGITPVQTEEVLTPEAWEERLMGYQAPLVRVVADGELAASVSQVLNLAYSQWQQGKRPHWSEVLPYYGQHPVDL